MKQLYLGGEWWSGAESFPVPDPGNGTVVDTVASAGAAEARRAIDAAAKALPLWRDTTGKERGRFLRRAAEILARRSEEIAETITRENGKALSESLAEVGATIDHLEWFSEEARRGYGRTIPNQAPGKRHIVIRQPVGVVAAISPWNFPLVLSARKVAPALAAGCPVILRPATQTPLCNVAFAEALDEAGIPPGVFQLIAGPAGPIAETFVSDPRLAKISFTGSTEVGKRLLAQAAQTVTKLSLELGGHAPVIVFEDADLDKAVEGAMVTKFRNNGQSCIACNRLYVHSSLYADFLKRFGARTSSLRVGYGLDDGVDIGPVVNAAAAETARLHIENALVSGARLVAGGRVYEEGGGNYVEPTVLADVPATAACMKEETFGPIAPVAAFDTEAEVIAAANDTRYGLAAYVFTESLNRALRVAEALEAGSVGVNDSVVSTSNAPFGGLKESGLGRELGVEGMEAFLETKHISIAGLE